APLFGKARRYDHRVPHAGGGALLERVEHRAGRNDDDGEIDRRADISDRPVAFQPIDIVVVRIDRIKLAGIVVLAQHRQQPAWDLLLVPRRADQGNTLRREETVERVRHSERPSCSCLECPRYATRRKWTPPSRNSLPKT